MPLGNNSYNSTNSSKSSSDYSPVTFSPVRFSNTDSETDRTAINFAFWKGMLKLSIIPLIISADKSVKQDKENSVDIFFSPTKARLFVYYLERFKNTMSSMDVGSNSIFTNVGVSAKSSVIYITTGEEEFGSDRKGLYIVIKGINDVGEVTSSIAYQFKASNSIYFGIVDYRGGLDFSKNFDYTPMVEFDTFISVFKNYINNVGGAIAASVVDATKYTFNTITSKLTSIQENLGIDTSSSYKSGYKKANNSFFSKTDGNGTNTSSTGSGKVEEVSNYEELIADL